jgi:ribulose-5-phosphate 4-epimerase/fuculose-1-phosphate aldolase
MQGRAIMATNNRVDVPQTVNEAIAHVVMANRILDNEGILDALGHVSMRNPDNSATFFQSRSLSPLQVTKSDILEIDLDGNVVTKTTMRPYAERFIHAAILKARPEVNAVFHGHPVSVLPFSVTDVPLRPVTHMGGFLYQGLPPIYDEYEPGDGLLIRSVKEAEKMANQLGHYRVQLLRGHGCNIVGENMQILVASAIYLSINATVQLQALQISKIVKCLSGDQGKEAMEATLLDALPLNRMWGYWVARARKNMPDID